MTQVKAIDMRRIVPALTAASLTAGPWTVALAQSAPALSSGDTAWMLISTVLVTLMVVPGVALFYAGMVRRKNALAVTACVFGSSAAVTLVWFFVAYGLAFNAGNGWWGRQEILLGGMLEAAGRAHILAPTVPEPVFVLFQLGFAMVTVALVFGAVVERMRFGAALGFAALWVPLVYAPVAHAVWHPEGALHAWGHVDYAGGTVVHLASGVAGLVLAGMVGPRQGYGREAMPPHNLMLTVIGAGLLWVGWFGFNGGSAFGASHEATRAVLVTQAAAASGVAGWLLCEWITRGQISLLGLASGLVAGLIAITPASGYVGLPAAFCIGALGATICFFSATALKARLGYDDSLDVFGMHGMAGLVGTVLTGAFLRGGTDPLMQAATQGVGALAVMAYVAVATWALAALLRATIGLRVQSPAEQQGLDLSLHGESLSH
jgi:Amt family ammonium transporter